MLNYRKVAEEIVATLNTLRCPIANCSDLAEDEKIRLRLSVRDRYRQSTARSAEARHPRPVAKSEDCQRLLALSIIGAEGGTRARRPRREAPTVERRTPA